MSRTSVLILLGVLTILAPFSGLPVAVRSFLSVIFGACILGIAFSLRAQEMRRRAYASAEASPETYSEPEPMQPPQGVSPI